MSIISPIIDGGSSSSGGSSANSYVSGNYYPLARATAAGNLNANRLYLFPFVVRKAVTIDELFWYRDETDNANVYVGIMDQDGTAVTDCAADSDTTVEVRKVSTSSVELSPDKSYVFGINSSVTFRMGQIYTNTSDDFAAATARGAGLPVLPGYQYPTWYVPRNAAAITGSIDITTGAVEVFNVGWGGFKVA